MTLSETVTRLAARPPSRHVGLIPSVALALDLVVVGLASIVAVLGSGRPFLLDGPVDSGATLITVWLLVVAGWTAATWLLGGYRGDVFGTGPDEYRRVLGAGLLTAGLLGVGCYLLRLPVSRGSYLLLFVVGVPAVLLGRRSLRRLVQRARDDGALLQQVLIAGSPERVDEVATVLRRERWLGYQVAGALVPPHHLEVETPSGVPVVGNADDVATMRKVDVVLFAGGSDLSARQMRSIVWDLERYDTQVVVAPHVFETSGDRVRLRPVGGLSLMHIDPPTWNEAARLGKRAFDLLGSLTLLVALSPLFVVAAAVVRMCDGGPLLFKQVRVGRHGVEFTCFKIRTMVTDAEARLAEVQALAGHATGERGAGLFKMKDDPRVTRSGRWLRRYSIDELPQLVNVLRGEMSLVGPRPPLPYEVATYGDDTARRLHVRPGMTGLWQVSGRSDLSWHDAIRLDLYYVDNWSMVQDLTILLRTVGAVLSSRGAY